MLWRWSKLHNNSRRVFGVQGMQEPSEPGRTRDDEESGKSGCWWRNRRGIYSTEELLVPSRLELAADRLARFESE